MVCYQRGYPVQYSKYSTQVIEVPYRTKSTIEENTMAVFCKEIAKLDISNNICMYSHYWDPCRANTNNDDQITPCVYRIQIEENIAQYF